MYLTFIGVYNDHAARLRTLIAALVRRFALGERADVSCCGVTVAQAATLEALLGGPIRQGALGRRLGIDASTLTRNLDRLQERGLVTRTPDPDDRRATRVALTTEGEDAAGEVTRGEEAFVREILAQLPEGSAERAVQALEELLAAVRRATEGCCPGAFDHLMSEPPWKGGEGASDESQLLRQAQTDPSSRGGRGGGRRCP
jgi:DNA-binding MarR family transcriptional regulator